MTPRRSHRGHRWCLAALLAALCGFSGCVGPGLEPGARNGSGDGGGGVLGGTGATGGGTGAVASGTGAVNGSGAQLDVGGDGDGSMLDAGVDDDAGM